MTIADNIEAVRRRIAAAAERAGRDPTSIKLIAVTKGVPPAAIREALAAGVSDFGESFLQEALLHIEALAAPDATWHFIGHLQTNKAAAALAAFPIIHSVDSLRLAEQLSRRSTTTVRILLEVNVAAEATKYGFTSSTLGDAVARIGRLPHIDLAGLMTVAPAAAGPEAVRPVFRELRDLATANGLADLSMGMSDDFEVAIEEGATMVRLGRAIFGERST